MRAIVKAPKIFCVISTTEYEGGRDEALIQTANLEELSGLGFTENDVQKADEMLVSEALTGDNHHFEVKGVVIVRIA